MHRQLFATQGDASIELSTGAYGLWEDEQVERKNWVSDPLGLVMGQGQGGDGASYVLMFFPVPPAFHVRKPQLWGILKFAASGYSTTLYSAQRSAEDAFAGHMGLAKPRRGRGRKKKEVTFAS